MLLTNDPGFEADVVRAADPRSYGAAVAALLSDPGDIGERQRAGAEAMHSGDAWLGLLEALYARALESEPARPPAPAPHAGAVTQWELVHHLLFEATAVTCSLRQAVRDQMGVLPPDLQPSCDAELDALCRWTGVAVGGDGVDALPDAVGELRAMHLAGVLERCIVTVPAAGIDDAIPVLERSLAEGEDFPLDLVTADDAGETLGLDRALRVA